MTTKLGRGVTYHEGVPPITLESCGLARSRNKPKPLYLQYHNAYGHKTSQEGDLSCSHHRVT